MKKLHYKSYIKRNKEKNMQQDKQQPLPNDTVVIEKIGNYTRHHNPNYPYLRKWNDPKPPYEIEIGRTKFSELRWINFEYICFKEYRLKHPALVSDEVKEQLRIKTRSYDQEIAGELDDYWTQDIQNFIIYTALAALAGTAIYLLYKHFCVSTVVDVSPHVIEQIKKTTYAKDINFSREL